MMTLGVKLAILVLHNEDDESFFFNDVHIAEHIGRRNTKTTKHILRAGWKLKGYEPNKQEMMTCINISFLETKIIEKTF